MSESTSSDGTDRSEGKSPLEWSVTGVGVLIVAFVVGFFVYEWITSESGPADLTVSLGTPTVQGDGIEVPVDVKNVGHTVAQVAVVEVCAGDDSCAQITFDYVPHGSKVSGQVGLDAPLGDSLTSRVVSFVDP